MTELAWHGYTVEVDEPATRAWYAQAEEWSCTCGHCRNFLALAKERRLPEALLNILDGLGMGVGFTLAQLLLGVIREFLGSGTFFVGSFSDAEFGVTLGDMPDYAMSVFVMPAGGFLTLGLVMAAINAISDRAEKKREAVHEEAGALIDEAVREHVERELAEAAATPADNAAGSVVSAEKTDDDAKNARSSAESDSVVAEGAAEEAEK